ncbi:hypothetical protein EB796_012401 [Bugula neritina]|uniref:Uncharacterized protein n=1 Tax=Bugula neritina TaxID=10212 RepID=A0A7J7JTR3_BUGNE|nr:hypothetical protein EB796_012401 [Bugula neritina]
MSYVTIICLLFLSSALAQELLDNPSFDSSTDYFEDWLCISGSGVSCTEIRDDVVSQNSSVFVTGRYDMLIVADARQY